MCVSEVCRRDHPDVSYTPLDVDLELAALSRRYRFDTRLSFRVSANILLPEDSIALRNCDSHALPTVSLPSSSDCRRYRIQRKDHFASLKELVRENPCRGATLERRSVGKSCGLRAVFCMRVASLHIAFLSSIFRSRLHLCAAHTRKISVFFVRKDPKIKIFVLNILDTFK